MLLNRLFRLFRNNETKVHELNYLFWECTARCNLHCLHCGSDCTAVSQAPDMPLEDFLRALDTIPREERPPEFTVVLTGGEPLLRPDIADIGQALRGRGVLWSMVSNGYFYDEAMHRKLLSAGLGALTISLDGLEQTHDWMRGHPESYRRALRAIRLSAAEPRLNFDVVTCINARNYEQLEQMYEVLREAGVPQWRLFTIIPIGRAKDNPLMRLSPEQTAGLMEFIAQKRKRGGPMNVTFSCEGYLGKYERIARSGPHYCRAGINIGAVLLDGRICACPDIDRDVFSQGSIYEDSLWEVWNTRFQPFRDRSWARKGACKDCSAFRDCLGGGMHNWHGACEGPLSCNKIV